MKILYVSDSLAANVHSRGIYAFSTGLIKILKAAGFEITLLSEQVGDRAVAPTLSRRLGLAETQVTTPAAASHFFNYGKAAPAAPTAKYLSRIPILGRFFASAFKYLRLALSYALRTQRLVRKKIDASDVDFLTSKVGFLTDISEIAISSNAFLFAAMLGRFGWRGPSIDAREFDAVIVDTPTNIRVRNSKKTIQVVHDLIPLTDPTLDGSSRNRFAAGLPHAIENYTHYLFVSDFTKRKFYSLFASAAKKSLVFYPRVSIVQQSKSTRSSEKYALLVISDEPRKNIENTLEAAFYFNEALRLYVVGDYDLEKFQRLVRNINSLLPGKVRLLGYVSATTKSSLIANAVCVVVPAFAEGFGLPIAEGFAHGTPVACADTELFHEVAVDLATYFNPYDPISIADAVNRLDDGQRPSRNDLMTAARRFSTEADCTDLINFVAS